MTWSQERLANPVRVDAAVLANGPEPGGWRLALRVPGWPGSAPGHFVMLSPGALGAAERSDPLLPRPMAVFRADGDRIEVLYKVTGRGTALLSETRPGERVRVVGPLGRAFAPPASGARAVLIGGGTGIASLYDLAARLPGRTEVLLGARSAPDLMAREDFAALGAGLRVATEDGSEGHRGRVTDLLEASLAADATARVYACGPTPMMHRAAEIAAAHGAVCQVSLENTMACGFGVCLGCAAPLAAGGYALVCREGPVFDARAIAWASLP